jgi:RNA polymerase sigma-70 factor (ECF subfamily)
VADVDGGGEVTTPAGTRPSAASEFAPGHVDPSYDWVARLTGPDPDREEATRRLHGLMVRASRYQLCRMSEGSRLGEARCEEIVQASADEATVSVLRRLDTFEGRSRFTTWAYKFAILQTAVEARRAVWRPREVDLDFVPEPASGAIAPEEHVLVSALAEAIERCIVQALTAHQRRVLVALVIDGVPIDVLADRLVTTRNALYKTLHDARKRLRHSLTAQGFLDEVEPREAKQ